MFIIWWWMCTIIRAICICYRINSAFRCPHAHISVHYICLMMSVDLIRITCGPIVCKKRAWMWTQCLKTVTINWDQVKSWTNWHFSRTLSVHQTTSQICKRLTNRTEVPCTSRAPLTINFIPGIILINYIIKWRILRATAHTISMSWMCPVNQVQMGQHKIRCCKHWDGYRASNLQSRKVVTNKNNCKSRIMLMPLWRCQRLRLVLKVRSLTMGVQLWAL